MLTYKDLLLTGLEAVLVLDAEFKIRQHNQPASLLLGYRNRNLTKRHLSDIVYDDVLIRHLLAQDNRDDWSQGECKLRTSYGLPLVVKYRAGPVMDNDQFSAPEYHLSEERFPPSPRRLMGINIEKPSAVSGKGYVIVFREPEETRYSDCNRRIKALQTLLKAISERNMEPEDMLLDFVRAFDPHAEAILLPPYFAEDDHFSLPQQVTEAALKSMWEKVLLSYRDESLWFFFPVCSQDYVHGVACVKFAVPRFYTEEDENIFSLAGTVLDTYMETATSRSQGSYSRPLLRSVINIIDQPIIVVDRMGVITLCNPAAQAVYGYSASEMMGQSFGDLVFPADSPVQYADLLDRLMRNDSFYDAEMTHLRKGWNTMKVSFTARPYTLADGLIAGAIFIIRELTERRRLWSKMMQWEKLSALGELLSSVANELNNPLTSLIGYSQMLLHRKNDEDIDSMASTIYEEAKRCGDIVRSALDLTRGSELYEEYSHINNIITGALNLKRRQLKANNIDVSVSLAENIDGAVADPHDIERLFLRIINYTERRMVEYNNGGQLTVESVFEEGNIVVRFSDTGTCILKDDVAEILDPFFTASREGEGVELGLSISCQILRNIGGDICVDNQMGKGNVFTVKLPVMKRICPHAIENSEKAIAGVSEIGKRILVVDDEPAIVDLLVKTLQQMGHVADIARDGNEAMNRLNTGHYDLIIADLRMPSGFTGDRLHRFIKIRNPELAQRIIFITGDVTNPETREFLQGTGNPYLEKPFLLESLQETIKRSLSRFFGS